MDMNDYQDKMAETRMPSASGIDYSALGLCAEAGEVANKVKRLMREARGRDFSPHWSANLARYYDSPYPLSVTREQIIDELGDALCYLAYMAEDCGTSLNFIAEKNIDKLRDRYLNSPFENKTD